jgi:hypothetical protein
VAWLAVCLLLAAVTLWVLYGPAWRRQRVYAFTGGLMQRDRRGELRAVRWTEITAFRRDVWRRYVIAGPHGPGLLINNANFRNSRELGAFIDREAERHGLPITNS